MLSAPSITSSCVQLLVQDCESACVTCFNAMVKVSEITLLTILKNDVFTRLQIPWQLIEGVGDQSTYVTQLAAQLHSTMPLIRENLSSARKYFINFCHKFAK